MSKKYRQYEGNDLFRAAKLVTEAHYSLYKASKQCNVPWSTLKDFLKRNEDEEVVEQCMPKLGKPFALSAVQEQRIVNYIITMQELGFGLTVVQIRKLAYQIAERATPEKKNPFNKEEEAAGEWWWKDFRNRHGLCLRVPENIASYRSSMANRTILNDFYDKLKALLVTLGIENRPDLIWNCDETGLSYVVKPSKIVTAIGKKYVYKKTYADRGENHTMLACVNASGHWVPPVIIFKGVRMSDDLHKDKLPGTLVQLSAKGWMNSDIFLEWFNHFIASIPTARPVLLLMDSHASHVSEGVIALAKANSVFILTFPSHTTHLLQPLDVGVYRPFKQAWGKSLSIHMSQNPGQKPNRSDFHTLMKPAFYAAFSPETIISSFRKTGIFPFNPSSVADEAISTSKLTEKCSVSTTDVPNTPTKEVLKVPVLESTSKQGNGRKRDGKAKCLTPPESRSAKRSRGIEDIPSTPSTSRTKSSRNNEEDWECGSCGKSYNNDVRKKNGAKWIQCSFCLVWYHTNCQPSFHKDDNVFMCDGCHEDSD